MPLLLLALLILATFAPSLAEAVEGDQWRDELLGAINDVRGKGTTCGGAPMRAVSDVRHDHRLTKVAMEHATRLATGQTARAPSTMDRVRAAGYRVQASGEMYAAGSIKPRQVVQVWLKNPVSCKALMAPEFRDVGLGLAGIKSGPYKLFWVLELGRKAI